MTIRSLTRWTGAIAASLLVVFLVGCGEERSYEIAEVDGVLLIDGQPAPKIRVQFSPDVTGDDSPPSSMGETDADGHFTLMLRERDSSPRPGAAVGQHRVVLRDLQLAQSATGAGVPIRISPDYALVGRTRLREEVKEGKQTIEINLPPYRAGSR